MRAQDEVHPVSALLRIDQELQVLHFVSHSSARSGAESLSACAQETMCGHVLF